MAGAFARVDGVGGAAVVAFWDRGGVFINRWYRGLMIEATGTSIGQNPFTGNSDCKRKFKVEKALVNGVCMQKQAQNIPKLPKIARACGATLVNGVFSPKNSS